jgi:hypothetical protein
LIAGLWFGAGAFLILAAAPAAFSASPNPALAADVVGALLTRWHYLALLAPLALLGLQWRQMRGWVMGVLLVAIVFASAEGMIDIRIREMRAASVVPISALPRENPLRRRFGLLHGLSSLLLLGQVLAAAATTANTNR